MPGYSVRSVCQISGFDREPHLDNKGLGSESVDEGQFEAEVILEGDPEYDKQYF